MQYSVATILSVFLAGFLSTTQALPSGTSPRNTTQQLADAQNKWQQDTSVVSQFLGAVPNLQGAKLQSAAQVALNAENDELLHKKVLDGSFPADSRIIAANDILVNQGTFQFVVDALANFAQNGATMSPSDKASLLQQTNQIRCGQVLPAIDTYFHVAGETLNNGGFALATRPVNC
ncbi:hypothetical protein F4777DRAFT_564960 [Nemania sp. FL0916]|nr:hypothetical protein F4777DRAFT_564960 [Nemania sp. FL0916]